MLQADVLIRFMAAKVYFLLPSAVLYLYLTCVVYVGTKAQSVHCSQTMNFSINFIDIKLMPRC